MNACRSLVLKVQCLRLLTRARLQSSAEADSIITYRSSPPINRWAIFTRPLKRTQSPSQLKALSSEPDYLRFFSTGVGWLVSSGARRGSKNLVVFSVTLGIDCNRAVVVGAGNCPSIPAGILA